MASQFLPASEVLAFWGGVFVWSAVAAFLGRILEFLILLVVALAGGVVYCLVAGMAPPQAIQVVLAVWIIPQLGYFFGLLCGAGYSLCVAAIENWRSSN